MARNEEIIVLNIRDFIESAVDDNEEALGEKFLLEVLSEFSCEKNVDVQNFLKEQAIDFTKKNQSVTYLVFSDDGNELLGYFTLAVKAISIHAEHKELSKSTLKKIKRVSELDEESGLYTLPAFLIAQLGKNFSVAEEKRISGEKLLQAALDTVKKLQYGIGGMVVFLEAENNEKLLTFYDDNRFKRFDTRMSKSDKTNSQELIQLLRII